jgi:hypothetical protein
MYIVCQTVSGEEERMETKFIIQEDGCVRGYVPSAAQQNANKRETVLFNNII